MPFPNPATQFPNQRRCKHCRRWALRGKDICRQHGGRGHVAKRTHKRKYSARKQAHALARGEIRQFLAGYANSNQGNDLSRSGIEAAAMGMIDLGLATTRDLESLSAYLDEIAWPHAKKPSKPS